jgi:PepSY-associated TM region
MNAMGRMLWRATIIVHRYLGVALGLLMLVWFLSGIVMMYVGFPELEREERLKALPPIPWQSCCALEALGIADDTPIRGAGIETIGGEPALFLRPEGAPSRIASLAPSGPALQLDETRARATAFAAAERILRSDATNASLDLIERDQWTVGGDYGEHRPMYRYSFDDEDRTQIYVSGNTGQVVLYTTANERFWNWLGAVPHWLYPTILRQNGPLWAQVVIWSSLIGGFLTLIGIVLGVIQFRRFPSGRYSPYRGWFYWHHITGLVFGVITLTWVISGTLSLNPWGLLEGGPGRGEGARLFGEAPKWSEVKQSLAAIKESPLANSMVELRTALFAGKLFWIASDSTGKEMRLDATGKPAPVTQAQLQDAAARVAGDAPILAQETITEEDAYYFSHHEEVVLPAYRVMLNDADRTTYYFDPNSLSLVRRIQATDRQRRWLFEGLHRIDFTAALRWRPVWDAVTILLLLGGIAVTGTGTWLGFLRIKRDLTFRARTKSPVPESAE